MGSTQLGGFESEVSHFVKAVVKTSLKVEQILALTMGYLEYLRNPVILHFH